MMYLEGGGGEKLDGLDIYKTHTDTICTIF